MGAPPIPVSAKQAFLERLAAGHRVKEACQQLGLNRASIYHARHADAEFGRAWADCRNMAMDAIRDDILMKVVAASGTVVRMPLRHPDTGEPVLDQDFEPIMVDRLVGYDRELVKALFNKVVPSADAPAQTNVQVNTAVHAAPQPMPRLVRPSTVDSVADVEHAAEMERGATSHEGEIIDV